MQFGIFSVGDVTPDPTTGRTPTERERGLRPEPRDLAVDITPHNVTSGRDFPLHQRFPRAGAGVSRERAVRREPVRGR
ncbi:hypothetical protein GCM10009535_10290 [Streptomyces thermocarboxydovorans]|uniref:Uncharacterized protein n=1 Tax=Streptomyces thermocarboxydovorans TaxID=59298 RepID=A0ABN1HAW6_9ACTN